ncbi:hypothetical protein [Kitasatospora camelliae]|uniref:DUF4190 domain-containing protein n=1 Tax=Kitasatospora camelliae TaxID=3156397 RepID=A0AAU8JYQ5_9ACTN
MNPTEMNAATVHPTPVNEPKRQAAAVAAIVVLLFPLAVLAGSGASRSVAGTWRECMGHLDASLNVSLGLIFLCGTCFSFLAGAVAAGLGHRLTPNARPLQRFGAMLAFAGIAVFLTFLVVAAVNAGTPYGPDHCPGRDSY